MSLHLYIGTQCCQAWHIHLQFKNIVNTMHAVRPAIYIVGRHYGVNHLHEPGRSLDYSSDSCFSHCLVSAVPVSAGYGGGSRMWRYISIVSVRQVDFNIYLLWDCGRFLTASDCRRLFRFNTRPFGRRGVRTTSSRWTLWIPTRYPGSRRSLWFV